MLGRMCPDSLGSWERWELGELLWEEQCLWVETGDCEQEPPSPSSPGFPTRAVSDKGSELSQHLSLVNKYFSDKPSQRSTPVLPVFSKGPNSYLLTFLSILFFVNYIPTFSI